MKQQVQDAVDFLSATFSDVSAAAKTWQLNAKDVQDALKEAEPGTAEYYVLTLLAQSNPIEGFKPPVVEPVKTEKVETENNPVELDADSSTK